MDTIDGRIYEDDEMKAFKQMKRRPPRVGRNELCPCGSGKKFKLCCFGWRG